MVIDREPLKNRFQTANRIKNLVKTYYTDLDDICVQRKGEAVPLADLGLEEIFDYVRGLPYQADPKPKEIVSRPYHLFSGNFSGIDCKKKSLLMGSWARRNGIPYRFVGSSQRDDKKVHHIFPQFKINGSWINADATYPDYRLGETKQLTYAEVL
jgi:hypothetical protein